MFPYSNLTVTIVHSFDYKCAKLCDASHRLNGYETCYQRSEHTKAKFRLLLELGVNPKS